MVSLFIELIGQVIVELFISLFTKTEKTEDEK